MCPIRVQECFFVSIYLGEFEMMLRGRTLMENRVADYPFVPRYFNSPVQRTSIKPTEEFT